MLDHRREHHVPHRACRSCSVVETLQTAIETTSPGHYRKARSPRSAYDLADKTGELDDVSHDIGYLLVPGRETALSVLTSFHPADFAYGQGPGTANRMVQQVASAVYDHLRQPGFQGGQEGTGS